MKAVRLWAGDVRVTSFQPWCPSSMHLDLAQGGSEPQVREMGNEGGLPGKRLLVLILGC